MDVLITSQSKKTKGPQLEIDCPKCGASKTAALSYEQKDRLSLFYVIPVCVLTNTFVKCGACSAKLTSRLSLDELKQHAGSDVSEFLSYEISFIVKFLAIASIVLFWIPVVGLILAILAVVFSGKSRGWPRTLGMVALVLSTLVTLIFFLFIAMGQ